MMPVYYEWDENKRLLNLEQRKIDFRDADKVYESPEKVTIMQTGYGEERYLALAPLEGRLYALVYTVRGDTVRIVSYRKARHPRETRIYDHERNNSAL
jgi:uncharacterized DUF497 family protein